MNRRRKIEFQRVAEAARGSATVVVTRWLPDGSRQGREWVAINPTRTDGKKGSFKVNLNTGAWSDFATGAAGRDLISLAAYLYRLSQVDAAIRVAAMLGVDPYE